MLLIKLLYFYIKQVHAANLYASYNFFALFPHTMTLPHNAVHW